MTSNKKRRHHYVWRRYLRSWAINEKIFCLRDNKIINTNLMNVAQQRDFYKLKELTCEDVKFIKWLAIDHSPKNLIDGHEKLLAVFSSVSKLKAVLRSDIAFGNDKAKKSFELYIHNLEEDLHSSIENSGDKYLADLLMEKTDFFTTDIGYVEFLYFLCVQYMRTKQMKESVIKGVNTHDKNYNIERCWNLLSHIFATNIVHSFCDDRDHYKLVLIRNTSSRGFITGDQPVINIFSINDPKGGDSERLAFYYPISPKLAILIIEKKYFSGISELDFDEKSVNSHNQAIVGSSLDQIFARDKDDLESFRANFEIET